MTTDVIFTELKLYETNLSKLLTTYELAHKAYLASVTQQNGVASQMYLLQMNDLNQEILLLMADISQHITKLRNDEKYTKYKTDIAQKSRDLNTLYGKVQVDTETIKGLMRELTDLDGKNATLRLQHTTNRYAITGYLLLLGLIIYFFLRFSLLSETSLSETSLSETSLSETVVLLLAIFGLTYMYWPNLSGWLANVVRTVGTVLNTLLKKV